jgi:hypothetical protein
MLQDGIEAEMDVECGRQVRFFHVEAAHMAARRSSKRTVTMIAMRRFLFASSVLLAVFGLVIGTCSLSAQEKRGRKYKPPPPTSKIEVTVLKDFNGKPIENASVIFHTLKDPGNMELKSNEDGKALIDVVPMGETVRLQIIAKGYQTYGGDYSVDSDGMAIEVRMKRPGAQYSIYKSHPVTNQKEQQSTQQDKKDQDSKDKPADSSKPQ